MSESTNTEKGLFETLEERLPEYVQCNSKSTSHEKKFGECDEKFEFLVQDMFLDHFFP